MIGLTKGKEEWPSGSGRCSFTPMFQLHCIDNDPSLCIWNQLDFDLPFEARNPVAMMIPDEIVPNCN